MTTALQPIWQQFHPDAVPVGHTLAGNGTWNLTRFHLLPGGRDAALSRPEYRSLIERYNKVATEVLGDGETFWLIVPNRQAPTWAREAPDPVARARWLRFRARYRLFWQWDFFSASDNIIYNIEAEQHTWRPHLFDRLFLDIYNEKLADIILMNAKTGAVVVPYIAGLYVSQPSPAELIHLISRYYGWLPEPGQGLLRFDPAQMTDTRFELPKSAAAALQKSLGN
jgi:hypothetical protein